MRLVNLTTLESYAKPDIGEYWKLARLSSATRVSVLSLLLGEGVG
jgi:hypothetical protein